MQGAFTGVQRLILKGVGGRVVCQSEQSAHCFLQAAHAFAPNISLEFNASTGSDLELCPTEPDLPSAPRLGCRPGCPSSATRRSLPGCTCSRKYSLIKKYCGLNITPATLVTPSCRPACPGGRCLPLPPALFKTRSAFPPPRLPMRGRSTLAMRTLGAGQQCQSRGRPEREGGRSPEETDKLERFRHISPRLRRLEGLRRSHKGLRRSQKVCAVNAEAQVGNGQVSQCTGAGSDCGR